MQEMYCNKRRKNEKLTGHEKELATICTKDAE